eukprot:6326009-Alexandrium_andersonii.AAC.1
MPHRFLVASESHARQRRAPAPFPWTRPTGHSARPKASATPESQCAVGSAACPSARANGVGRGTRAE